MGFSTFLLVLFSEGAKQSASALVILAIVMLKDLGTRVFDK